MKKILLLFLLLFSTFSLEAIVYEINFSRDYSWIEIFIPKPFINSTPFRTFPTDPYLSQPLEFRYYGNYIIVRIENPKRVEKIYVLNVARNQTNICQNIIEIGNESYCYYETDLSKANFNLVSSNLGNFTVEEGEDYVLLRGVCQNCIGEEISGEFEFRVNYGENDLIISVKGEGEIYYGENILYRISTDSWKDIILKNENLGKIKIRLSKKCESTICEINFYVKKKGKFIRGYKKYEVRYIGKILALSEKSGSTSIKTSSKYSITSKSNDVTIKVRGRKYFFVERTKEINVKVDWGNWIIYDNITLDSKQTVNEPIEVRHLIGTEEGEGKVIKLVERFPENIKIVWSNRPYVESVQNGQRIVTFNLNETINPEKKLKILYKITSEKNGEYDIYLGEVHYYYGKNFTLAPKWYHIIFYNPENKTIAGIVLDKGIDPKKAFLGTKHKLRVYVDPTVGTLKAIIIQFYDENITITPSNKGAGEFEAYVEIKKYGPLAIWAVVGNKTIKLQRVNINRVRELQCSKKEEKVYICNIKAESLNMLKKLKQKVGNYTILVHFEIPAKILANYKVYGARVTRGDGKVVMGRVISIGGKRYIVFEDDPHPPYRIELITAAKGAPTLIPV